MDFFVVKSGGWGYKAYTILPLSKMWGGLGLELEDRLLETKRMTPTSFLGGPVTEAGGQKAL